MGGAGRIPWLAKCFYVENNVYYVYEVLTNIYIIVLVYCATTNVQCVFKIIVIISCCVIKNDIYSLHIPKIGL